LVLGEVPRLDIELEEPRVEAVKLNIDFQGYTQMPSASALGGV